MVRLVTAYVPKKHIWKFNGQSYQFIGIYNEYKTGKGGCLINAVTDCLNDSWDVDSVQVSAEAMVITKTGEVDRLFLTNLSSEGLEILQEISDYMVLEIR